MALDAQYLAPGSMAAAYHPHGGDPLPDPVRVIRSQEDQEIGFGQSDVVARADTFLIRRSDRAEPMDGDVIVIAEGSFRLVGEPRTDVEGLEWTCPAEQFEP
ncbi:conserved hypothetical protein [Sphingomonas sp. AX6]|nr:hypothetical protein [Sphingomonas sp. AX6]VXC63404.1 conserved hypothetical protein [Sphingomonas sp. AX6]